MIILLVMMMLNISTGQLLVADTELEDLDMMAEDTNCTFTQDCKAYSMCQDIQDVGCVCNFGKCVLDGLPYFRGDQCNDWLRDCSCRYAPELCFCRNGWCDETAWECRQAEDCLQLE